MWALLYGWREASTYGRHCFLLGVTRFDHEHDSMLLLLGQAGSSAPCTCELVWSVELLVLVWLVLELVGLLLVGMLVGWLVDGLVELGGLGGS